MNAGNTVTDDTLEIIAFMLHEQQFCVKTTSIREIRGWAPVTPLPRAPADVMGVMNLRGTVIPIVDLAVKLGMAKAETSERSAIVVTSIKGMTVGLMVDRVSDILTVAAGELQPVPAGIGTDTSYAQGIIARDKAMICFLNLEAIFADTDPEEWSVAA
ncbi:chemotaxis protein CheW [Rhizobiaceae bacterium BDR2-2]|uniref:Chemotaxis protein CheW n=1 Tax=Ectorhizobium quercum TaxID=2965071 RepID=A0AAE3MZD8_9HYPH|nr:chemotaxis protein CheW [Ectorhizobium quercum]MCX8997167.1 chemotaxis protein CheW [Ectorhizobium quercum]